MIIEVLSPIHIGTGESVDNVCYHESNNEIFRYEYADVMQTMPLEKMLDDKLLRKISSKQTSNEELSNLLYSYVDYRKIKPIYKLSNINAIHYGDVDEQIKTMNKPYIPGSSVKGAILHSLLYSIIKENYHKLNIEKFLLEKGRRNLTLPDVFIYILDGDRELFNRLSNCLVCEDLYFNKLFININIRINVGKDQGDLELPDSEAILPEDKCESNLFSINKNKVDFYLEDLNPSLKNKIYYWFNEERIMQAINEFTKDMIEVEKELSFYSKDIIDQLNKLNEKLKNTTILRIGKYTNYYEKSISILVKKNNRRFYEGNYDLVFSPTRPKKSNKKTMPKTRTISVLDGKECLPGYLGITR